MTISWLKSYIIPIGFKRFEVKQRRKFSTNIICSDNVHINKKYFDCGQVRETSQGLDLFNTITTVLSPSDVKTLRWHIYGLVGLQPV